MKRDLLCLVLVSAVVTAVAVAALRGLDSDGDGVSDDRDVCCSTPSGSLVDEDGRLLGDFDGDCDVDLADYAVDIDVDLAGYAVTQSNFTGPLSGDDPCPAICGNGVVEAGEQCDPPNGDTCDANCRTTTGGEPANDSCASPTAITVGSHSLSNVGATMDGPPTCAPFGNPQIDSDIWYCFTAPCTEAVTVSLCGSAYDTKVAVYLGCDCPSSGEFWLGCSDDDCGAGQESRTTFPGLAGQDYLIRVGGFRGFDDEQGTGTLTIFCESDPDHGLATCGPGAGDCFSANGSPGCEDVEVCTQTCAADMSCCDRLWDELCATKADGITNGFDTCGPGNGNCTEDNGTPGCDEVDCCQSVCEADPFCCLTEWDEVCAAAVPDACLVNQVCASARGSCFAEHESPGCDIESCCVSVCDTDPLCCTASWDDLCVEITGSSESCGP